MFGYIYKTTNLVNHKIYIGQHRVSKFSSDYLGSGRLISYSIKKYGRHNFKVELIKECFSQKDLNDSEKFYIDFFNSTDLRIGYNIAKGGWAFNCEGLHWYNNGVEEIYSDDSILAISSDFKRGRLKASIDKYSKSKKGHKLNRIKPSPCKGTYWFNNGKIDIMSKECPEGFVPGRTTNGVKRENNPWHLNPTAKGTHMSEISKSKLRASLSKAMSGRRWWTDGVIEVFALVSPGEDFILGRLKRK